MITRKRESSEWPVQAAIDAPVIENPGDKRPRKGEEKRV
jgi:hypothetical protein